MPEIDQIMRPTSPDPKTWGETWPVIETDVYGRYGLSCIAGGYSSLHYHRERANRFLVVHGAILVWQLFGPQLLCSPPLTDGQTIEVPSFVLHGFGVLEPSEVIEEYWPDRPGAKVSRADIFRVTHGGQGVEPADMPDLPHHLLEQAFGR